MSVVVGVFETEPQARQAVEALRRFGIGETDVAVRAPGGKADPTDFLASAAYSSDDPNDLPATLVSLGIPEGEVRFYASEAQEGRTLVVVDASGQSDAIRQLVLDHRGYDVQSRGRAFIRPGQAGVSGGTGARPMDVTDTWEDFRSRYQMLWQQHYGTTDQTWEQMEPTYQRAWQIANRAEYRGRPWSEAQAAVRDEWQSADPDVPWSDAEGPIRDVWEDVAEEAATGAEGGADRRIAHQGSDQSIAARDIEEPGRGAA